MNFHKLSCDAKPLHHLCSPNCPYRKAPAENQEHLYTHEGNLPAAVMDVIKPVFQDLCKPELSVHHDSQTVCLFTVRVFVCGCTNIYNFILPVWVISFILDHNTSHGTKEVTSCEGCTFMPQRLQTQVQPHRNQPTCWNQPTWLNQPTC